jgi:Fe-S-cluster-containing hydrogenase components 1
VQCAVERNSLSRTLREAVREEPRPFARVKVGGSSTAPFPLQCRHCGQASCLAACPSGALSRNEEHGLVTIDQNACRGCWMCVMSCPFGAIIPSADFQAAFKCDACIHMDEPACVAGCPTGALLFVDEREFGKVLARRRKAVALWIDEDTKTGVSLDCVAQEDTPV